MIRKQLITARRRIGQTISKPGWDRSFAQGSRTAKTEASRPLIAITKNPYNASRNEVCTLKEQCLPAIPLHASRHSSGGACGCNDRLTVAPLRHAGRGVGVQESETQSDSNNDHSSNNFTAFNRGKNDTNRQQY